MIAKLVPVLAVAAVLNAANLSGSDLKPQTITDFDRYIEEEEARISQEQGSPESFLGVESLAPAARAQAEAHLRRGEVLIEERGNQPQAIAGGLIHHWAGTVFIPNATLAETMTFVQDYDHLAPYYRPEVLRSKLTSRHGGDFRIAMRLQKRKIITVVLDAEYDVHYGQLDRAHAYSASRSTRITEIAEVGQPHEHALLPGHDHGFLWRLNTYWRFVRANDGVFVQCEAISLTRDVPAGLGWMIGPLIEGIPRESLQFTLRSTRDAILRRALADNAGKSIHEKEE